MKSTTMNILDVNHPLMCKLINNNTKYLIMSEHTRSLFEYNGIKVTSDLKTISDDQWCRAKSYDTYCGVPVAICNTVPFGKVEFIET